MTHQRPAPRYPPKCSHDPCCWEWLTADRVGWRWVEAQKHVWDGRVWTDKKAGNE